MSHYETLGVGRKATPEEVKKAYRKKAQRAHPDRNPGSDGKEFHAIQRAYEVLSDEKRRDQYDRTGEDGALPDPHQVALQTIAQAFIQMASHPMASTVDILGEIRRSTRDAREREIKNRIQNEQVVKNIEKNIGRFKRKGGKPNALDAMLLGHIGAGKRAIEMNERAIELNDLILKMLSEYEDTAMREKVDDPRIPVGARMGLAAAMMRTRG